MSDQKFTIYELNGGTVVGIAGRDYAVIGADTELLNGKSQVLSTSQSRLSPITDKSVLGCAGCWCDSTEFTKIVKAQVNLYKFNYGSVISTPSLSQLVSSLLYLKRVSPFMVSNVLAGIDKSGCGLVYKYDALGHMQQLTYTASGMAEAMVQPFLDNQIGENIVKRVDCELTKEEALTVLKDAFAISSEKHIHTGDRCIIKIITKSGIEDEEILLKKSC